MVVLGNPPKMVHDETGALVEVVLAATDFKDYLRALMEEQDWESLPRFLQDSVDSLLIDEVVEERDETVSLESVVSAEG